VEVVGHGVVDDGVAGVCQWIRKVPIMSK
jgi:hypothetical protein